MGCTQRSEDPCPPEVGGMYGSERDAEAAGIAGPRQPWGAIANIVAV